MENKKRLVFFGEAMLELVNKSDNELGKSFAGDVYNTSVYLKRAFPEFDANFVTALGQDKLSEEFISRITDEKLGLDFIAKSSKYHMGIYMVVNDETGERSFIYWRNNSSAKRMMSLLYAQTDLVNSVNEGDVVFYSGITIAILLPEQRELFWEFIDQAKEKGATIMFDPNYRPALWENVETAKQQIELAFAKSDWLLPGVDDFKALYGLDTAEECITFCEKFGFEELVMKQGKDAVHIVNSAGHEINEVIASKNVVDTTSAGDAFNGVYIGARLQGKSSKYATRFANYSASKVIETPGAIMPSALFEAAMTDWKNSDSAE